MRVAVGGGDYCEEGRGFKEFRRSEQVKQDVRSFEGKARHSVLLDLGPDAVANGYTKRDDKVQISRSIWVEASGRNQRTTRHCLDVQLNRTMYRTGLTSSCPKTLSVLEVDNHLIGRQGRGKCRYVRETGTMRQATIAKLKPYRKF